MPTIHDYKGNSEIIVEIGKPDEADEGTERAKRRGAGSQDAGAPASGDYLTRRKKAGIKINFYDLGWKKGTDGIFRELPFVPRSTIYYNLDGTFNPAKITQADYDEITAAIFAVPAADWKSKFKNLSQFLDEFRPDLIASGFFPIDLDVQGESFDYDARTFAFNASRPGWTPADGLTIKGSETGTFYLVIRATIGGLPVMFNLLAENLHVTKTFNYAGEPARITLAADLDIFFVPQLVATNGISIQVGGGFGQSPPPNGAFAHQSAVYNSITLSFRRAFYERLDPSFKMLYTGPDPSPGQIHDALTVIAAIPGNLATQDDTSVAGTYPSSSYVNTRTTTPASGVLSIAHNVGFGFGYFRPADDGVVHRLFAIVRSKDQYFYIWEN